MLRIWDDLALEVGLGYAPCMGSEPRAAGAGPLDAALAARAAKGESAALAALYDRHAPVMLGVAVRLLKSRAQADELVHDVFIEAWQAIQSYDPERGSVRAWLLTRLRSRALDRLRRRARADAVGAALAALPAPTSVDPADGVDAQRVQGWMRSLPEPQREALELAYFEGLSMKLIAEKQGVAVGTVKARVSRAVARLRAERGGEPR